MNNEEVMKK